jgi:hypothetical protein
MFTVEYIEGGINKIESGFETLTDAMNWAERNGLHLVPTPRSDYEGRIVKG